MKKLVFTAIALIFSLSMATASFAASASVDITVTVVESGLAIQNVGGASLGLGTVAVDSDTFSGSTASRGIFRNIGTDQSDWEVSASAIAWTYLTDAPGTAITNVDECRLSAIWAAWDLNPTNLSDFDGAEDTLSTTAAESSDTVFARAGDPVGVKGYDVPAGGERSLWFLFEAPITGSSNMGQQQTITVTVNALVD